MGSNSYHPGCYAPAALPVLAGHLFSDNLDRGRPIPGRAGKRGRMVRKVVAWVAVVAIAIGGAFLMALAGLLALLITDPIYPFLPVFLPLGLLATVLIAWLMGRIPVWLFPGHPDQRLWTRIGWAGVILGMAAWGTGVGHFCTMPMHWQ